MQVIVPIGAQAVSLEVLDNPSFENRLASWLPAVNANLFYKSDVKEDGTYSCFAADKYNGGDGPTQDITDKVNFYGRGKYDVSAYLMLSGSVATGYGEIVVKTQSSDKTFGSNGLSWYVGNSVAINTSTWSKLDGQVNLDWRGTLEYCQFYFIVTPTDAGSEPTYFDNCSMIKNGYSGASYVSPSPAPTATPMPTIAVTPSPAPGAPLVNTALFLNPPMKDKPYKMVHSWKANMNNNLAKTLDQKFAYLSDIDFGGVVTNVDWNQDYLQSDTDFNALNDALNTAKNHNMGTWLYDEDVYPSTSALTQTVQGHPEYEAMGVGQVSAQGTGKTTTVINIPTDMQTVLAATIYPLNAGVIDIVNGQSLPLNITNGKLTAQGIDGNWTINIYGVYPVFVDGVYLGTTAQPRKYPNLLNKDAVARFIEVTYQQYKNKIPDFANKIGAFFTDEPSLLTERFVDAAQRQLNYPLVPWDSTLAQKFQDKYGYDLLKYLPSIFGGASDLDNQVRQNYYELVGDMMNENFSGQLEAWCAKNGTNASGHFLCEESLDTQIPLYGDYMKTMSGMGYPGIDILDAIPEDFSSQLIDTKMVQSIARNKNINTVMAELCPVANLDVFNTNYHEYAMGSVGQLYLNGINHLNEYYTPDRDSLQDARIFNTYVARMGYMLEGAKPNSSIAIYYPTKTAQQYQLPSQTQNIYDSTKAVNDINSVVSVLINQLTNNKLDYSLLIEDFIDSAIVKDGNLIIGGNKYSELIMPDVQVVPLKTMQKIDEFAMSGGTLIFTNCLPTKSNLISENAQVQAIGAKYANDLIYNSPFGNAQNLALGATVTAGSTDTAGNGVYNPKNVTDGVNDTSNWASWSGGVPNWVQIDLGSPKTFNSLALYTQKSYEIGSYTIEYKDGNIWKKFVDVSSNTKDVVLNSFNSITAQYIRVNPTVGSVLQPGIARINEIELYNVASPNSKGFLERVKDASNMKLTLTEANPADAGKLMLGQFMKNGRELYMVANSTGTAVAFSLAEFGAGSFTIYNPYDGSSYVTNSNVTIPGYRALFIEPKVIEFSVDNVMGAQGRIVTVNVNISANSNIAAATFELDFDSTKLDFVSAQAGSIMNGGLSDVNATDGKVIMAYINEDGLESAGSILQLQFYIKDDIPDQTIPLNLSVPELTDINGNAFPMVISPGSVNVCNVVYFAVSSEIGYRGRDITEKIDISKNSNVSAATIELNFDSTKLDFVSADVGDALSGGLGDINSASSKITLAYINTRGVKAEGTILEVHFKIKEGLTDQISSLNLAVLELVDIGENILPSIVTQGAVTIKDYMLGDVDNSGSITSSDALMALQIASGRIIATEYTSIAADVNKNDTVTASDALQILQFASGKITSF